MKNNSKQTTRLTVASVTYGAIMYCLALWAAYQIETILSLLLLKTGSSAPVAYGLALCISGCLFVGMMYGFVSIFHVMRDAFTHPCATETKKQ